MKRKDQKQSLLGPMLKKTFESMLSKFFEIECPQIGGELTRKVLVQKITELFNGFFPELNRMKMGQIIWNAVNEKEISSYGKSMEKVIIKPVKIDLVTTKDIEQRLEVIKKREVRKQQVKRIFEQAKEQGAVLTYTDTGEMIGLSASTVGKYVREMEDENGYRLPHRGLIHDMEPTVTHKKQICFKILVEGKSVEKVLNETNHSAEAITRYVVDYKRIHTCLKQGLSIEQTAYCTKKVQSL